LKVVAGEDSDDTALCAKRVAEGMLPRTTATLASQIAAKRYGLNIISYNMHHDPFNTTTFLLVSKK
jgi:prephenate dehydratase